jgi:hypothetical protein
VPTPATRTERRRAPRALANFQILLSGAEGKPAQLKDISEIGLACVTNVPLSEMTVVAIDFNLPGQAQKHRVQGAVVRCEPTERKTKSEYELAVWFTDVPAATKAALKGFVARGKPAP